MAGEPQSFFVFILLLFCFVFFLGLGFVHHDSYQCF